MGVPSVEIADQRRLVHYSPSRGIGVRKTENCDSKNLLPINSNSLPSCGGPVISVYWKYSNKREWGHVGNQLPPSTYYNVFLTKAKLLVSSSLPELISKRLSSLFHILFYFLFSLSYMVQEPPCRTVSSRVYVLFHKKTTRKPAATPAEGSTLMTVGEQRFHWPYSDLHLADTDDIQLVRCWSCATYFGNVFTSACSRARLQCSTSDK